MTMYDWLFLICCAVCLVAGAAFGGMVGFITGYDWAMAGVARLNDKPVVEEQPAKVEESVP